MKAYNLYYKHNKLNKRPLSQKDILELKNKNFIGLKQNGTEKLIPISQTKLIECIII